MKIFKNIVFIFLIVLLLSCSKYKEPAPFFDGLILEYEYGRKTLKKIYKVSVMDDNEFEILRIDTFYRRSPGLGEDKMKIDAYGRVIESSTKLYKKGKFVPIWKPTNVMKIGDKFDGDYLVDRRERWEKWEVLVIKDITLAEAEEYYEINTGYLVGSYVGTRGGLRTILINTNAEIPTVEE